jgi:hypothetical protein
MANPESLTSDCESVLRILPYHIIIFLFYYYVSSFSISTYFTFNLNFKKNKCPTRSFVYTQASIGLISKLRDLSNVLVHFNIYDFELLKQKIHRDCLTLVGVRRDPLFFMVSVFLLTFCIKCMGSKFQTQVYMFFLS